MDVLKQCGCTDCGLFALAFGTSLYNGKLPSIKSTVKEIWGHIYIVPLTVKVQPFLSSNQKVPANLVKKSMVVPVFCHCCQKKVTWLSVVSVKSGIMKSVNFWLRSMGKGRDWLGVQSMQS